MATRRRPSPHPEPRHLSMPVSSIQEVPLRIRNRWRRAHEHRPPTRKLTRRNLERLCRENATSERTLVVHSEDVDHRQDFPNAFTVTKRADVPADMHTGLYYEELSEIPAESYAVILCTGLLEHIPDPQRIVDELHRILTPGGKLIISASAVFSYHEGPDDFFHFTPYSFQLLFRRWSRFKMLRGASQPFETIEGIPELGTVAGGHRLRAEQSEDLAQRGSVTVHRSSHVRGSPVVRARTRQAGRGVFLVDGGQVGPCGMMIEHMSTLNRRCRVLGRRWL
jgi:SAM-dependent methyltransferase